jgi:diguanylate cyclase (GGDEF)-like protein
MPATGGGPGDRPFPAAQLAGPACVLAYLACTLVPGIPSGLRLTLVEGALTVVPGVAAAVIARAARRHRATPLWLLAAACASWAIGNAVWDVYMVTVGDLVPFPSFADPFYLLFLPLAAAGVLRIGGGTFRTLGRLRLLCDSLISGLGLFTATWPLVLRPIIDESPNMIGRIVSCAYPVGDVALLALVAPALGRVTPQWRPVLVRVGLAFAGLTSADLLFAVLSSTGTWTTTHPLSVGWIVTFCALAAASGRWPDSSGDSAPRGVHSSRAGLVLLSYLPVVAGVAVALGELVAGGLDLVTGLAVLAVLALGTVRQQLAFWENDSLTRDLEDRVALRTAELAELAYTDLLTGLANRASFAKLLAELAAAGRQPTVVLLDLDGFKAVNDTLGHAAGDELLASVASRLRHACPDARLLARLGGDEFAIVLPPDSDPSPCAEQILTELAAPFCLEAGDDAEVRIGASIGIAGVPLPDPGSRSIDSGDVLRDADIAMYAAKAAGRNRWRAFDPVMRQATKNRKSLEDDLHAAVRHGELTLAYQPVVHLPTGRIVGSEALLRWNHPVRGLVPPVQFIPVAEETGLIIPIGAWVLEEACRQTARWKRDLPPGAEFGVGINLSVHQLQPGLLDVVRAAVAASGLPADALVLEVTESVFMDDDRTDPMVLQDLRGLGPKIFLDDFGTGFSSLSYLRRFPIDGVKIDRSFVSPLSDGDDVLAAAIVGLAQSFQLGVVAEGIEEPEQRSALQALGCHLGQGFGMYRPMTADAMTAVLHATLPVPAPRQSGELPTQIG